MTLQLIRARQGALPRSPAGPLARRDRTTR